MAALDLPEDVSGESIEYIAAILSQQLLDRARRLILNHGRQFQIYLKQMVSELLKDKNNLSGLLAADPKIINTALSIFVAEAFRQYYVEILEPSLNAMAETDP